MAKYTIVKNTAGEEIIVANTVKDSIGGAHVVQDNALDTGAGSHPIFADTVDIGPVPVVEFEVTANRIFVV